MTTLIDMTTPVIEGDTPPPTSAISDATVTFADGTTRTASPVIRQLLQEVFEAWASGQSSRLDVQANLVTPEQAAGMLGVSRPTVYAWQDRGRLGRTDLGSRRMVPFEDIAAVLAERRDKAEFRARARGAALSRESTEVVAVTGNDSEVDLARPDSARPGSETRRQRQRRPER